MSAREALDRASQPSGEPPGWFSRNKKFLARIVLFVVAALIIYVVVASIFPYLVWLWVRHVSNDLALRSGLSPNLVLGVVIIATIPFFYAVWKYGKGIFRLWMEGPSLRLYSNRYGLIIVCYVAVFFFAQYFAGRNAYYSKWCADTPEGIKTFDTFGTGRDPTYGIKLHHCTLAEIVALRRKQVSIVAPKEIQVSDPEHFAFFDPVTAAPRVWYYRTSAGRYRLYDGPGNDSATGAALRPMDAQTRDALIGLEHQAQQRAAQASAAESKAQHASFVAHFLNAGAAGPVGAKRTAVLILEGGGQDLSAADNYLLSQATRDGLTPTHSLFRPAFVSEGRAAALFNGDWSKAQQIDLANHVKYLILGTAKVSYTQNGALEGVRTAKLELHLKALNVRAQSVLDETTINISGAGFSESAALDNAIVHAEPQLASFAKSAFGSD